MLLALAAGFGPEQAEVVCTLMAPQVIEMLSKAIAENSNRFAAFTHTLYNALAD
jgi:hypothetical protein